MGDKPIYLHGENADSSYILFESIEHVVFLERSERQCHQDPDREAFDRVLRHCQEGQLDEDDWNVLKTRFIQTAQDTNCSDWDNATRLFYDNKSTFEYNMTKLQRLNKPIAKLEAKHNCRAAAKRDSTVANGLQSCLYFKFVV